MYIPLIHMVVDIKLLKKHFHPWQKQMGFKWHKKVHIIKKNCELEPEIKFLLTPQAE